MNRGQKARHLRKSAPSAQSAVQTPTNITVHAHPFPINIPTINLNIQTHNCYLLPMSYIVEPLTLWPRIDGSGHLSSRETTRGIRTNTLTASTDTFKVIESIDDRAGSYYFSPALIASSSRRKQRPLHPPPARLSRKGTRLSRGGGNPWVDGSSSFDRAGSDYCIKGWSRRTLQSPQCKPIGSTRIDTGQSSLRGRVRCQSHLVAWERRRREPGSNSVIVTIALTRDEGHVAGRGGLQRVRKIFAGCPAIPSLRGQSPVHTSSRSVHRSRSVGNRPVYYYGQPNLCRPAAEAQIQDRSRTKTGSNTAPAFPRVFSSFPRRREPSENKARNPNPQQRVPSPSMGEG